ncbi:hypothetical protein SPI_02453 [Niveomyces insectorum RCEF 264]|uniref:Rhodopsin domain-containing protein n=1 Tax=Niveomyces insectorum RCEF 264 TaxID=1081102 RepID=A0A167Y0I0_9HYPO|nr:hypothetical protein SPI_02453 [Niveomyces insectorum RCEF 264]
MDVDAQFNLTAYFAQPTPWQNEPAALRGIVITVTITTLTSAIAICIAPTFGLGQHLISFTAPELRTFLILFYIGNASYVSSTAFMKLSLLFQYVRIFSESNPLLRRLCQVLLVIVGLWGLAFSFMAWVPCFPVYAYWDLVPDGGRCYGFGISTDRTAFVAHTAINMALDVFVLAIPVPIYFDGTAPLRTRAGLLILLLLGLLVNVFATWRLVLLVQSVDSFVETIFDSTYYAPVTVLLASLEVNLASICASVPIFWPVLRQQVFRVLVTKEVEITRGERYDYKLDSHGGGGGDSRPSSSRMGSRRSLVSVEDNVELAGLRPATARTANTTATHKQQHYGDDFIMDQVDPLRPNTSVGVETLVRSDTGKKKKRGRSR